jgi:hypothetical protein
MTPSQDVKITEVASLRDVPRFSRAYAITKDYTVDMALEAFEKKYGVKAVTAVLYKSYLYVSKEEEK